MYGFKFVGKREKRQVAYTRISNARELGWLHYFCSGRQETRAGSLCICTPYTTMLLYGVPTIESAGSLRLPSRWHKIDAGAFTSYREISYKSTKDKDNVGEAMKTCKSRRSVQ